MFVAKRDGAYEKGVAGGASSSVQLPISLCWCRDKRELFRSLQNGAHHRREISSRWSIFQSFFYNLLLMISFSCTQTRKKPV